MLKIETTYGKIEINPGWLKCPACGKPKLLYLLPNTTAKDLPVFCKRCKREIILNISTEPEP